MAQAIDLIAQDLYSETTGQQHPLGAIATDKYGNTYRYAKAGGSNLVTGTLLQEPAEDTQFNTMTVPAAVAIGETAITVTNGTTTVTANMFAEGYLVIDTSTGIGQQFRIVSHTTGTSGAAITYNVDRPLKIALTTSSKVSVRKNPYNGVIINPATTSTGAPVGVATTAMTAAAFGWIQVAGDVAVLFDTGANTANDLLGVEPSLAVAGALKVSAGTSGDAYIGISRQVASVDSTASLVHLMLG